MKRWRSENVEADPRRPTPDLAQPASDPAATRGLAAAELKRRKRFYAQVVVRRLYVGCSKGVKPASRLIASSRRNSGQRTAAASFKGLERRSTSMRS
jgi:hypothetical protein